MYLFKSLLAALATLAALIALGVVLSHWPAATMCALVVLFLTVVFAANGTFHRG